MPSEFIGDLLNLRPTFVWSGVECTLSNLSEDADLMAKPKVCSLKNSSQGNGLFGKEGCEILFPAATEEAL
jgi:hypothetical protein